MVTYSYAPELPTSERYQLLVNGKAVHVIDTETASLACFECTDEADIEVSAIGCEESGSIHPLNREITGSTEKGSLSFRTPKPQNLTVQFPGFPNLYLHISPIEAGRPSPEDPNVIFFEAGRIHETGQIEVKSGQTVYIEGGAVVRGCIQAYDAQKISIRGRGILDGSCYTKGIDHQCSIHLGRCANFEIRDIAMIHPSNWMIVPVDCTGGLISNIQQIGEVLSSDGIDIVGSRNILIEDCQMQNHDDCVVIKSLIRTPGAPNAVGQTIDGRRDVENVLVRRCIFENTQGVVFEIGHELITESVKEIYFTDSDVLHSHTCGSIAGIHNCDRATVSDVLFDGIRVEHYWDKIIDLRVMDSEYASQGGTGQIRNVTIRNFDLLEAPYNIGYTTSLIGGFDAEHTVEQVKIENIRFNGKKAATLDQLNLFTRHASDISVS